MDIAGNSFLVGNQHLVVRRRFGFLGFEHLGRYVAYRLGSQLRQRKRPTKGE